MKEKKRLDIMLTEQELANSRENAKALIMSGIVYVDNQKADKPGLLVSPLSKIEVRGNTCPYVSRGGYKLEKAINVFNIDLKEKIAIDIGASTGGFTDCMLQRGAKNVCCIDVGYGQLAWKLRTDERVVNFERTNIRYVTKEQISEPVDFISIDVSFISLKLVIPVAKQFLKENGEMVCLIKPQFEAGREKVGKNGVIRDKNVHIEVIKSIIDFALGLNFSVKGLDFSPIKGPKGNIEYILYLINDGKSLINDDLSTEDAVESSHSQLNLEDKE